MVQRGFLNKCNKVNLQVVVIASLLLDETKYNHIRNKTLRTRYNTTK